MSCDKNYYLTSNEARKHLRTIANYKDNKSSVKPIRCYHCEKCGMWHLTSQPINKTVKSPVWLSHKTEWKELMKKQEIREDIFAESPVERQIRKALVAILHNINIQCEILDEKFKQRAKIIRVDFNRKQKQLIDRYKLA